MEISVRSIDTLLTNNSSVVLRQVEAKHATDIFFLSKRNEEHLTAFYSRAVFDNIENVCERLQNNKLQTSLGVWYDGMLVGVVELLYPEPQIAAIGYFLDSEFLNRGIMKEAVKVATRIGLEQATEVRALVHPENIASCRVLENNGYQIIDRFGTWRIYSIKKEIT